jgi:hypothetical protein
MAKIANVALTDTFNTWRTRSNATFDRISQFAINNSSLYANTLTANVSFTSKGLATFTGRATVGTNLTVSGNTTLGAAGKTMTTSGAWTHTGALTTTNFTVSGNSTIGGSGKTIGLTGSLTHTGTANVQGWFGVAGRATVSTNLFVGGNTVILGTTRLGCLNTTIHPNSGTGAVFQWNQTAGSAETDIYNTYVGASESFRFHQTTGAGTAQTLYSMAPTAHILYTDSTERFRIASGGLITACNSMTITQNAVISGNTSVAGRLAIGLASASADQPLHVYTTAATGIYNHVQHSGAYNSGIHMQNVNGSWYTYIAAASNQYEIYGGNSATVQFSIAPSGAVTIAKNATLSTNLTVSGNTTLNGTTIDKSNTLSQTLTDGATINWDVALGRVATLTLGAAGRTMAAPTNLKVGTYILRVYQDATGSRTITTWNSVFKWTAAVAPVLSTGANKLDIITFFSDGTNLYGSYLPDMR